MEKKPILLLILFAIVAILFYGCPNIQNANTTIYSYTPNDELYDYCAFDKSSYWLYEDSATQEIDSVVVTDFYKNTYYTERVLDDDFHKYRGDVNSFQLSLDVINRSLGSEYSVFFYPMVYYPNPKFSDVELNQYEYYYLENTYNFYGGCPYMFAYTNISNPNVGQVRTPAINSFVPLPYTIKYLAFYDNYTINGHNYKDVKKIEFLSEGRPQETILCYWAKYVGLVRQEYYTDSTRVVKNIKYYNVINVPNQYNND